MLRRMNLIACLFTGSNPPRSGSATCVLPLTQGIASRQVKKPQPKTRVPLVPGAPIEVRIRRRRQLGDDALAISRTRRRAPDDVTGNQRCDRCPAEAVHTASTCVRSTQPAEIVAAEGPRGLIRKDRVRNLSRKGGKIAK